MIYFIQAERSKAIKIGKANDPHQRLAAFRTSSPEPLKLLGTIPGDLKEEAELHQRFSKHRLLGEWFEGEHIEREIEKLLFPQEAPNFPKIVSPLHMFRECNNDGRYAERRANCPCCGFQSMCLRPSVTYGPCEENTDSLVEIAFFAECGSHWCLTVEHHEGMVDARIVILTDCRDRA